MPKISALPEVTSPASTDLVATVKASGSRRNKKVTLETLTDYLRETTPPIDIRSYGVTTSSTDNQTTFQTALTNAAGKTLRVPEGTYIVGNTAGYSKTYNGATHYYCLSIPSNTTLILDQGATIKLKDAANAHLFTNSDTDAGNSNIMIQGGTIDLNQANQTAPATGEQSGGLFHGVTRLVLDNIKYTNCRQYALRVNGITKGTFTNLWCTDSDDYGFAFGLRFAGFQMTECFFDNIRAENCTGSIGGNGNGFIFVGTKCQIGSVYQTACKLGIKIQDGSSYIQIGRLHATGTTAGQGVKIQGTDEANGADTEYYMCSNITVGQILTSSNYSSGPYIVHSKDISIGEMVSYDDSTGADAGAIFIDYSKRINIGTITVNSANYVGVYIGNSTGTATLVANSYININNIIARNSGQTSSSSNVTIGGDYCTIGNITTIDDQTGSETASYGLNVLVGASYNIIGRVIANGSFTTSAITNTGNASIFESQIAGTTTNTILGGNCGIGNASPQALLHVGAGTDAPALTTSDIIVTRAGSSSLSVRDSTNNVESYFYADNTGGQVGTYTSHPFTVVGGNQRINLLATGVSIQAAANLGGYLTNVAATTETLSGASTVLQVNIPISSKLLGVQFRVDTAITGTGGATTWSAAYSGGSTTSLVSGIAFTKNTKANAIHVDEITSAETDITITPNAGTFTGGVLRVYAYYVTSDTMGDAA